jgi:hypothetical protein
MAATNVQAFPGDVTISSNLVVDTNTLFVDSVGNRVGIGTTNPRNILEVRGGDGTESDTHATFGKAVADSAGWSGIRLGTPYAAAHDAYCSVIESYNDPTSNYASILRFKTSLGDTAVATEHMRIQSNGNVGIGTDAPTGQLEVHGEGQTSETTFNQAGLMGGVLALRSDDGSAGSGGAVMFGTNSGFHAAIKASLEDGSVNTRGRLAFFVRNDFNDATMSHAMTINDGGNVGIGTTEPGHKLDLLTYTANDGIRVQAGSKFALLTSNLTSSAYNGIVGLGDGGIIFSSDNDASSVSTTKGFVIAPWSTSGPSGLKIIENGNVGIGTNAPANSLHLYKASNDQTTGLFIEKATGASGTASLFFGVTANAGETNNVGVPKAGILFERTAGNGRGDLKFCVDYVDDTNAVGVADAKMTITGSNGYVGIGTTAPKTDVDINGNTRIGGTFSQGNPGDATTLSMRKIIGSSSGDIAFTFPLRLYCNWIPLIIKINVSTTLGDSGSPYAWSYTAGYRGADCGTNNPMNTGGIVFSTAMDGADPGADWLTIATGGNNVLTVTTKRNGRDNIIAECEVISFAGIYL